jgi:hypothetical protein
MKRAELFSQRGSVRGDGAMVLDATEKVTSSLVSAYPYQYLSMSAYLVRNQATSHADKINRRERRQEVTDQYRAKVRA